MIFTNAFFFVLVEFIEFVCFWQDHFDKQWKRQKERWARLTRPLAPTSEEKAVEEAAELQRQAIALANQDIKNYNYKTWWVEYAQAKRAA